MQLGCFAAGLVPCLAVAGTSTWNNNAGDNLWGTAGNWVSNLPPGSGDTALFTDPPGGGMVDLGGVTRTINSLEFSNDTGSYLLRDGTLALSQIVQNFNVSYNSITAGINASALTMNVSGGELDVTGKITATSLSISPTFPGGDVQFQNAGNAISTIGISGLGELDAFDPGSIGSASVALTNGTLGLYTDIANATYNNNVSVNGSGTLIADVANASGPSSNTVNIGTLSMAANAQLNFETRDNYAISVASTSITGAVAFSGTQTYLDESPSELSLGAITQTVANSSISLQGVGKLVVLNSASNYSGGTAVYGGMLVIGATGATGSGAVNIYSGGAVDISVALTSLPKLNIGAGGAAQAALAGNLTGAVYSGAGENVFLSPGSIIAATAGPVPVRGVDVSSAAYYLGITSDTQNVTVGENAGHTSIYTGAAFGLYTPNTAPFSGTISAAQTGESLPVYISAGAQEFSTPTFNTTDTTTGVGFFGPGEIILDNASGGTATVFTDTGSGSVSQSSFLAELNGSPTIAAGKTFNISNGILYLGNASAVAAGGIVNINSGGSLYLDPGAVMDGPSSGTFNINAGGAVYLVGNGARPGYGATFNYATGALVIIGGDISTGSPNFLPNNADIVLDAYGNLAVTGSGIQIGNGRRLTTSADNYVVLTGGTGISAASGATNVLITASASDAVLQIDDLISLPATSLQIGDTNSFTTTSFTARVSELQDGTVMLDNDSDVVKNLSLVAGTLIVGQTSADHFATGNFTQTGGSATFHGKLTLSGAMSIIAGTTQLAPNPGANITDSAATLTISTGASLDIGDNTLAIASDDPTTLRTEIAAAYDHGKWDQPGLTSSLIPAHPGTAIGYTLSGSAATIKVTWLGDANCDGVVNAADLSAMSATGTSWQTGDFNYDGKVNADDYSLFMLGDAVSGGTDISATVPEPFNLGLLVGLGCLAAVKGLGKKPLVPSRGPR